MSDQDLCLRALKSLIWVGYLISASEILAFVCINHAFFDKNNYFWPTPFIDAKLSYADKVSVWSLLSK